MNEVQKATSPYQGEISVAGVGLVVAVDPSLKQGAVGIRVPSLPIQQIELAASGEVKDGKATLKSKAIEGVSLVLTVAPSTTQGVLRAEIAGRLPGGRSVSQQLYLVAGAPISAGKLDYDGDGDVDWADAKIGARRHPFVTLGLAGLVGVGAFKVGQMIFKGVF